MSDKKNHLKSQTLSEVSPEVRPFVERIVEHWKEITAGVVGVLFVIFMFLGYKIYEERRFKKEKLLIAEVLEKKDVAQKVKSLKELLPKISDHHKPAIYINLASLYFKEGDYKNLYGILEELKSLPFVDEEIRIVASLIQAKALFMENKPKEALNLTKKLLSKAPKEYQRAILWDMGFYAEKSGNWRDAFYAYSRLKGMKNVINREYLEEKLEFIDGKLKKKNQG